MTYGLRSVYDRSLILWRDIMKKHSISAVMAASLLLFTLGSCTDKDSIMPPSESTTEAASKSVLAGNARSNAKYENGTYSGDGFSLYADPNIWKFSGSQTDTTCDLQLIVNKDINSCGISFYVSDDDHGGKSAQDIVMNNNNDDIIFTGAAATSAMTFYYYEWAIDENIHGRNYFADYGDRYLCAYAESSNFGLVENKISDLFTTIKLTENQK